MGEGHFLWKAAISGSVFGFREKQREESFFIPFGGLRGGGGTDDYRVPSTFLGRRGAKKPKKKRVFFSVTRMNCAEAEK